MYLSKKPQPPKYTLAPFLFLNVVSLMNGELFSTSSTDRLHVTLLHPSPNSRSLNDINKTYLFDFR